MKSRIPLHPPIAQASPENSSKRRSVVHIPDTLADLLDAVRSIPRFPSAKRTVRAFAELSGQSADLITLDDFFSSDSRDAFRHFLRNKGSARGAINTHFEYIASLRTQAEKLGWTKNKSMPEAWQRVLSMAPNVRCARVAEHFAKLLPSPADVTVSDLMDWERAQVTHKLKSYSAASLTRIEFFKLLRNCGYTEHQQARLRRADYGEPLEQFPTQLRAEVEALRRWQTRTEDTDDIDEDWEHEHKYAWGPVKSWTLKERSPRYLVADICRLYGFVKNTSMSRWQLKVASGG